MNNYDEDGQWSLTWQQVVSLSVVTMAIQGWTRLKISSFLAHPSPGASLKSVKSSHDVLFALETL